MKLLLDSCVWGGVRDVLVAAGHDVVWVGNWSSDPGDAAILATAHAERRILVTLDKDFGTLAIASGAPHCGILRLVGVATSQQAAICERVLAQHGQDFLGGAIITATTFRVRVRPPQQGNGSSSTSP